MKKAIFILILCCLFIYQASYSALALSTDIWENIAAAPSMFPLLEEVFVAQSSRESSDLYSVFTSTSQSQAYWELLQGNVDLIFVPSLTDKASEKMCYEGHTFEVIPIAKDALVFIVNYQNITKNVSKSQLQEIFRNELLNWKGINGVNSKIQVADEPFGLGTYELLCQFLFDSMPQEGLSESKSKRYENTMDMIGFSTYFYMNELYSKSKFTILSVDGVHPLNTTIIGDEYPFSFFYYAIIRDSIDQSAPERALVDYILSEEGQRLVDHAGYVPLLIQTGEE